MARQLALAHGRAGHVPRVTCVTCAAVRGDAALATTAAATPDAHSAQDRGGGATEPCARATSVPRAVIASSLPRPPWRTAGGSPLAVGAGACPYTPAVRELVSIAPDGAELFVDGRVLRVRGLAPDSDHEVAGIAFRTMPDLGALRCVFATGNDVHFGETVCGHVDDASGHEVFTSEPGATPYPEVMSRAAVAEIASCGPAAVVVKGDLTNDGEDEDYDAFLQVWGEAFGERLLHVRGNHDSYRGQGFAAWDRQVRVLDGVTLALLDTARPFEVGGSLSDEQLTWLDELGRTAHQPVVVLGHHPVSRDDELAPPFPLLSEDATVRLVEVMARRTSLTCYLAGHTHRNLVRRIEGVLCAEVACVKDFPGGWAEYRVHERGIAQVFHRVQAPEAVAWAERTRRMFGGLYGAYAMGRLEDRSFVVATR